MAFETIIVEVDNHIALVTLNRPDALNALNDELMKELAEAVRGIYHRLITEPASKADAAPTDDGLASPDSRSLWINTPASQSALVSSTLKPASKLITTELLLKRQLLSAEGSILPVLLLAASLIM